MNFYKNILYPLLVNIDPEIGFNLAKDVLHVLEDYPEILAKFADKNARFTDKRLAINIAGVKLDNPLIVAPGWDKAGLLVKAMYTLGFAGVEVGSVQFLPQPGSPKPRLFFPKIGVTINRFGFNSVGAEAVYQNLSKYQDSKIPIGINAGINKTVKPTDAPQAYANVIKKLHKYASYFVVNVSSPNTPGLRQLQAKKPLTSIIKTIQKTIKKHGEKPLFIKIAPDVTQSEVNDVLEVAIANNVAGIIVANTTLNEDIKAQYGKQWKTEAGGLSGDNEDYRKLSTQLIQFIHREGGKKLDIIGAGGVKDAQTVIEKIQAGAKAVQLISAIYSEGPELPGKITRDLVKWMDKNGVKNIQDIVGKN